MVSELFRSGFFNIKGQKREDLHQKKRWDEKNKLFSSSGFLVKIREEKSPWLLISCVKRGLMVWILFVFVQASTAHSWPERSAHVVT